MVLTQSDWSPDGRLVDEIDGQFKRALDSYRIHPDLIAEHANHEESIRTGGYSNRTLLELVQNAADALAGAGDEGGAGRVEIVLDTTKNILYCANMGRPFSKSGLTGITMAYLSGKRGDEIGRFGLGFKSVLAISDTPQVFSRSVSFGFNSPEANQALEAVSPSARRYPILRTAMTLDAEAEFAHDSTLAELSSWATTIVKLPNANNLGRLQAEIKDFSSEFLLFVKDVREIRLRVIGKEAFDTSHISRDLGQGILKIERPDGAGDEWVVQDTMHTPSPMARKQVGEAVSRDAVKVTVAIPVRFSRLRVGEFWSYFPLQDKTSASALLNAPWSVNDDRTTLLRNDYNREILQTLSETFVGMLPRLRTPDDPAAHLDYMPARGREQLSFGDEFITTHVPQIAASQALVPDATGMLRHASELRPLDFLISFKAEVHEGWILSPNTGDDVPSARCYSNPARISRLRSLFTAGLADELGETPNRDLKRALDAVPKRGLLTWLREWADGTDSVSAANAFRVVCGHMELEGIKSAKVIPTTRGLRSIEDKAVVFLRQEADVDVPGSSFVMPEFLAENRIESLLRSVGFGDLDPVAVLGARVASLSNDASDEELTRLWDSTFDLAPAVAAKAMEANSSHVKVPTLDGGWRAPGEVFDIDGTLADSFASYALDQGRCFPEVAHRLGVVRRPIAKYAVEDELLYTEYCAALLDGINAVKGPGERPTRRIDIGPGVGPGPVSLLALLRTAGASELARESWTAELLTLSVRDPSAWLCEDLDTGRTHEIPSPVRWAAERDGLFKSDRGYRPLDSLVAPALLKYEGLLPLFKGSSAIADMLNLPDTIEQVPPAVLKHSLTSTLFPSTIKDATLAEFVLIAARLAFADTRPPSIPARVGRAVEGHPPTSVFLAADEDEEQYLLERRRPYLRVEAHQMDSLVEVVGCRRFEDSFSFSIVVEGQQQSERITDLYPGLRAVFGSEKLTHSTLTRAALLVKRVNGEDGQLDQTLPFHLEGPDLIVGIESGERQALEFISAAFDLRLNNAEIDGVMKAGLDHQLEELRREAASASTDAERLEAYFGPDDLREALPSGLWQALEAQGVVGATTSIADLFITVYESDSIRRLQENFRQLGFPDVPNEWAGRPATISWLRKMGFAADYAGRRTVRQEHEFVVPGAVRLNPLHDFQTSISEQLRAAIAESDESGRHGKVMVELPTGAGKTRVASETVLRMFINGELKGPVLWIAQSQELCEQAVQTWGTVWRGLADERPLSIGRLWDNSTVHEPDTEFSVIIATDAKLLSVLESSDPSQYEWLRHAELVVVDEGHRAGNSSMYTRILDWLGIAGNGWARPLVGLSATPFKGVSESATRALAQRFGGRIIKALEGNAYEELARRGVLARVKHDVLQGVRVELSREEIDEASRLRRVNASVLERLGRDHDRMGVLVDHIMSQDPTWPILVFTPDVLSAQVLAASLRYQDVNAASVSGQTNRHQRRNIIQRFKDGDIQVLANCDLLIQGFDAPGVRALYIARPTFSPNAYIQMAGRGLRGPANGGKDECLIIDLADDFGDMSKLLGYREYESLWKEQG